MNIDATFWVGVSFFIFFGVLIYLKVPHKITDSLNNQISAIKKELQEADKLKNESKTLLSEYEAKISKSEKESKEIIYKAQKESEKIILEKANKFHLMMDERKKSSEQKINQMKQNALSDIKNASIKISIEAAENILKNSIDKNKLENYYKESINQAKISLKNLKT